MEEKIITNILLNGFAAMVNNQLAPNYDYASAYKVGDLVIFEGGLYRCISAVAADTAFDSTKWQRISVSDLLWFGTTSEYIAQAANIPVGTLIIITDDGATT